MADVVTHEQRLQALTKAIFESVGEITAYAAPGVTPTKIDLGKLTEMGNQLLEKIQNITGFNTLPTSLRPEDVERWLNV